MNILTRNPSPFTISNRIATLYKYLPWINYASVHSKSSDPFCFKPVDQKRKQIKWSEEEKAKLFKLVEQHGTKWSEFLLHFPDRSAKSLARCYMLNITRKEFRHGKWTPEDDNSLRELMEIPKYSYQWKLISESIKRSPKACQQRWTRRLDPSLNRTSWTSEEDELIIANVKKYGRNWHAVVQDMPGRDQATVAERYDNYLNPSLKKGDWSYEERKLMLEGLIKYGHSWSDIHTLIPWRSRIYIRNFFERKVMPKLNKLDPSLPEKERFQILLQELEPTFGTP
ncbi:hypothetical protein K493DRAFT_369759 [Basidiobolus meristosporus CBS 931.73]|uniref:Homeodomain-like protein n=1 Tax=Basidiobolus meristosporus CBS 931.73 TaxID=1314790 RepID=A0A1Y1YHA0_9FUNG|nr:hypothetical protein K493DRAFT_369759 [Basidiobolus meristosporus CBS 931.73]|eukprot:ORX97365.1 hypothetical protein K493DRAFT_369759 [Basidiobolus meristosporus CBS 931.73]